MKGAQLSPFAWHVSNRGKDTCTS